jgi:hypothetical protein
MDKDQRGEVAWAAFFHNDADKNRPTEVIVHPIKPGDYLLSVFVEGTVPVFTQQIMGDTDTIIRLRAGTPHKVIIEIKSKDGANEILHLGKCWK